MKEKSEDLCPNCGKSGVPDAELHQLRPGTKLRDRYVVGAVLGEGGFGITYIGCDAMLNLRVAIKEYYPNGYSNRNHDVSDTVTLSHAKGQEFFANGMDRFLREARVLAKFYEEPGVVGVRDFFQENGTAYIVMDFLDGVDLRTYLKRRGTIPAEELFPMMRPIMESLSKIHVAGIIHRDISPDNIMLLKNGNLKLLDFGAAREVGGNKSLSVVLKPGFAPEEQYRSKGNQGPWTDVYALCATMYCCLTGRVPDESLQRMVKDVVKSPMELGLPITAAQNKALMTGLQVQSSARYQSMEELMAALTASAEPDDNATVVLQESDYADKTVCVAQSAQPKGAEREVRQEPPVQKKQPEKPPVKKQVPKQKPAAPKEPKPAKNKKKRKAPYFGAAIVVVILVLVLRGVFSPGEVQHSITEELPNQREMTSDCAAVLKENGFQGQILSMDITNEKVSEKFKTGVFTCEVTAKDGDGTDCTYTVELCYDYQDGAGWVRNSDSKTTNETRRNET